VSDTAQEAGIPTDNLGTIEQMKVTDRINLRLLQEVYLALRSTREALESRAGARGEAR
jgi:hypothetical protein